MMSTDDEHGAVRPAGLSSVDPTMDATEHGPTVTRPERYGGGTP
jgi:hypothetical protein